MYILAGEAAEIRPKESCSQNKYFKWVGVDRELNKQKIDGQI
jgi:hypothetical protein